VFAFIEEEEESTPKSDGKGKGGRGDLIQPVAGIAVGEGLRFLHIRGEDRTDKKEKGMVSEAWRALSFRPGEGKKSPAHARRRGE